MGFVTKLNLDTLCSRSVYTDPYIKYNGAQTNSGTFRLWTVIDEIWFLNAFCVLQSCLLRYRLSHRFVAVFWEYRKMFHESNDKIQPNYQQQQDILTQYKSNFAHTFSKLQNNKQYDVKNILIRLFYISTYCNLRSSNKLTIRDNIGS